MQSANSWDIFCRVIDNYGDIGVCWRLAADLASREYKVRLWIDDGSALVWMAPGALEGKWANVEVCQWETAQDRSKLGRLPRHQVLVEGFGCETPTAFLEHHFSGELENGVRDARSRCWINLEYLSAEGFAERSHGLPSPIMQGPLQGRTRHFFFPGFLPGTGGLLREPGLLARQASFDPAVWLRGMGLPAAKARRLSLFCYEPPALATLLANLQGDVQPTELLVTAGRASAAVRRQLGCPDPAHGARNTIRVGSLDVHFLPQLSQPDYDHLLWSCDLNFVRGEDSLVRALWAKRPFVWQIYPQGDDAHQHKLIAMLDWLGAPPSWRQFHLGWNAMGNVLPPCAENEWGETVLQAHRALANQSDLATRLIEFASMPRSGNVTARETR